MNAIHFPPTGELDIRPSAASSKNDFDFLEGEWNIHNRKLISRLNNCTEWIEFDATQEMRKVLGGIGNVDNMKASPDGKEYEGMAIRLFNPATKLWSIYWADNNLGVMEKPVVGSFDKTTGRFYCRDKYNGKDIIMQFHWDISDRDAPVWSQAFSPDNGKTWEWNWYMYMTRKKKEINQNANQDIQVLELRNYIIKDGQRDNFIDYYEEHLTQPQNALNGFTLGQFKIKGAEDHFSFVRGFHNMVSRNKFLNDFYHGQVWKQHRSAVNRMLVNNDHVHLLKPLSLDSSENTAVAFKSNWFGKQKGIAVVDYYIANQKRDKLIDLFRSYYLLNLKTAGIEDISFWISETEPNEFTALPVFQDKDLLVSISFHEDEVAYQSKIKKVDANMTEEQRIEMLDTVTLRSSLIIYPTKKSFLLEN